MQQDIFHKYGTCRIFVQWNTPFTCYTTSWFPSRTCFTFEPASLYNMRMHLVQMGAAFRAAPPPTTYPDVALCAHNNGVIGQLQTCGASEHGHPVLGELQGDDHSFIYPCNIIRTRDLCLMRRQRNTTHTFSDMVLSANPGSSPHMEKRCSCTLIASMTVLRLSCQNAGTLPIY